MARIGIETDRVSEERKVFVACTDCPEAFHLGEQAEVLVTTDRLPRAILVPQIAVDGLRDGAGTVWTVEGGVLARRELTFGRRTLDGRIEVAAGLPDGASVVVEPSPAFAIGRGARLSDGGGA